MHAMHSCKQIMLMFTRWLVVKKKKKILIFVVFGVANHHPNCTKFDKARTKKKTDRQYRKSDNTENQTYRLAVSQARITDVNHSSANVQLSSSSFFVIAFMRIFLARRRSCLPCCWELFEGWTYRSGRLCG